MSKNNVYKGVVCGEFRMFDNRVHFPVQDGDMIRVKNADIPKLVMKHRVFLSSNQDGTDMMVFGSPADMQAFYKDLTQMYPNLQ